MRISCKLTKKTTKTEKFKKSLKLYSIITFETLRYKKIAWGNKIPEIFNYILWRKSFGLERTKVWSYVIWNARKSGHKVS